MANWVDVPDDHPTQGAAPGSEGKWQDVPSQPQDQTWGQWAGDVAQTWTQGMVLDPIEKAGQVAEHIPGPIGRAATEAGKALPSWLQDYLTRSQQVAGQHPWARTAANILPWVLAPGVGEGFAAQAAMGALAGLAQPLDPKDPNYWSDLSNQGFGGALLGGAGGQLANYLNRLHAGNMAQRSTDQLQQQLIERTPERTNLNMLQGIYQWIGRPAPRELTPEAAGQAVRDVGDRLNQIYSRMAFDPNTPEWLATANRVRQEVEPLLRQNPQLQEQWNRVLADRGVMPAFRAEPAATPPVSGVSGMRPSTIVGPDGKPLMLPETRTQGPMGTRSGSLSGQQLTSLMSDLRRLGGYYHDLAGSERQFSAMYNSMAKGIDDLRAAINSRLGRDFPQQAADLQRANSAYHWGMNLMKSWRPSNQFRPTAPQIAQTAQSRVGPMTYSSQRYYPLVRQYLEQESEMGRGGPPGWRVQPPQARPTNRAGQAAAAMTAHGLAHAAGVPGPLRRFVTEAGRELGRGAGAAGSRVGREVGGRPAALGTSAGQAVGAPPLTELVVTPSGSHWEDVPDEQR